MKPLSGLVLKIAERCNLNCSYCYMYNHVDTTYLNKPRFISSEILDAVIDRIAAHLSRHATRQFSITLHGGEPMLAQPALIRRFATRAKTEIGDGLSIGMQTNATLVTDEWLDVLADCRIQPGVSLDGTGAIHDRHRIGHDGRGSYADAERGFRRLQDRGLAPGILCVVGEGDGLTNYLHLKSLGADRVDFILPDVSHDRVQRGSATPVADYLIPIFDWWFSDDGPPIRIRLFENIIRLILGARSHTEALGGGPVNYVVVDTDGSILGNDCFKVCADGLADSGLNVLSHGFDDLERAKPLIYLTLTEGLPPARACVDCPEFHVCGGGSAPNRYSSARQFDNPSVWCADLLALIGHVRQSCAPFLQA